MTMNAIAPPPAVADVSRARHAVQSACLDWRPVPAAHTRDRAVTELVNFRQQWPTIAEALADVLDAHIAGQHAIEGPVAIGRAFYRPDDQVADHGHLDAVGKALAAHARGEGCPDRLASLNARALTGGRGAVRSTHAQPDGSSVINCITIMEPGRDSTSFVMSAAPGDAVFGI